MFRRNLSLIHFFSREFSPRDNTASKPRHKATAFFGILAIPHVSFQPLAESGVQRLVLGPRRLTMGVCDSGLGGLTVPRSSLEVVPDANMPTSEG